MKKRGKKAEYYLKMLDEESKYRAATGGEDSDEPFITPLLFSILDALRALEILLALLFGLAIPLLFKYLS